MTTERVAVFLISVLVYVLMVQFAQGTSFIRFDCEDLPVEDCAFAIGQGGRRCLLETSVSLDGSVVHRCQTSGIEWRSDYDTGSGESRRELRSIQSSGHIESDHCISACGLQRLTVGISTDDLRTGAFQEKICSDECRHNCPQVISFYNIIYAEEGEELVRVCDEFYEWRNSEREHARRLSDSENIAAVGASAPAPAPEGQQ